MSLYALAEQLRLGKLCSNGRQTVARFSSTTPGSTRMRDGACTLVFEIRNRKTSARQHDRLWDPMMFRMRGFECIMILISVSASASFAHRRRRHCNHWNCQAHSNACMLVSWEQVGQASWSRTDMREMMYARMITQTATGLLSKSQVRCSGAVALLLP